MGRLMAEAYADHTANKRIQEAENLSSVQKERYTVNSTDSVTWE